MNATLNHTDDKTELTRLVVRAQKGNREAFGELFVRFEKHVLAIALRRIGDYGEAQELTQDVFIQAMKKLDQLRVPEAFPGWLRSIAHRMAINHLVRKRGNLAIEQETLEATCVERETPLAVALAATCSHVGTAHAEDANPGAGLKLGSKAVPLAVLEQQRGGADLNISEIRAKATGSVRDVYASDLTTGNNVVDGGSFSGTSGLPTVIQNSGNGVLIQNALILHVEVK